MKTSWQSVKLGDICRFQAGNAFPRHAQGAKDGAIPFIKVSDMNLPLNTIRIVDANNWIDKKSAASLRVKTVPPGSVVFAKIGEALKAERLRTMVMPTAIDNNLMAAIPIEELVETRFLYYLLDTVHLAAWAEGSALPYLRQQDLAAIRVTIPSMEEQLAISATLGALDDKIESNRRSVQIIESLLVLEFQNLLRKESVEYRQLSELTSITKGVSYKSVELQPSSTSLVTLKSFDRNGGYKANGLKPYIGPYKLQQVIHPGEVVVAQTDLTQGAEVVGRAVRVPADSTAEVLVASLDLMIVRPNLEITLEYLVGVLVDEAFRSHCRSRTSGTTVLHLASDAIPSYMAPTVSAAAQQSFSVMSRPLLARADSLNIEAVELASLRNALMPELLSGRMRVPEAMAVLV